MHCVSDCCCTMGQEEERETPSLLLHGPHHHQRRPPPVGGCCHLWPWVVVVGMVLFLLLGAEAPRRSSPGWGIGWGGGVQAWTTATTATLPLRMVGMGGKATRPTTTTPSSRRHPCRSFVHKNPPTSLHLNYYTNNRNDNRKHNNNTNNNRNSYNNKVEDYDEKYYLNTEEDLLHNNSKKSNRSHPQRTTTEWDQQQQQQQWDNDDDNFASYPQTIPTPNTPPPRSSAASPVYYHYWQQNEVTKDDEEDGEPVWSTETEEYDNYDDDVRDNSRRIEWEACRDSSNQISSFCILPPPSVPVPTAILHFVGGTGAGSAPDIFYRPLLTELVATTHCAIVASIVSTVVLGGGSSRRNNNNNNNQNNNPLNHVRLARQVQEQFQWAYDTVLCDEYASDNDDIDNDNDALLLAKVPICGLGHSLGARLLVLLATLENTNNNNKIKGGPTPRRNRYRYQSMILMSFTNFGAALGIPGLAQLYQSSRAVEQELRQQQEQNDDDDWRDNNYDDDDDDDDDGAEWRSVWQEWTNFVQAGTTRVRHALTPPSEALEIIPNPLELWQAVRDQGRYSSISQTLLIQFDNDPVDQSALLAAAILEANNKKNNASDTGEDVEQQQQQCQVRFARLRGTHWTPISLSTTNRGEDQSWLQQINNRAGRLLIESLQGQSRRRERQRSPTTTAKKSSRSSSTLSSQDESFLELRQSIARYIIDVVAKQ